MSPRIRSVVSRHNEVYAEHARLLVDFGVNPVAGCFKTLFEHTKKQKKNFPPTEDKSLLFRPGTTCRVEIDEKTVAIAPGTGYLNGFISSGPLNL